MAAAVRALSRRLDRVDTRLAQVDQLAADVTAMGHGLAELTAQVKALAEATNRRILTAPTRADAGLARANAACADGDPEDDVDDDGQPNWLTVTDPVAAGQWLADAVAFVDDVLALAGLRPEPACWPLHPRVVVEVLALRGQHLQAYQAGVTDVSEYLSRWLPGASARITKLLVSCENQRAHICRGRAWEIPHLAPDRVAAWWVDTRGASPDEVDAFSMTRIP